MTVEVYKGGVRFTYTGFPRWLYDLAYALSGSANFTIIDSYSSFYGRYKGDPIADGQWPTTAIGSTNCWIVIECQTYQAGHGSLPKWQMKIQTQEPSSGFADPSDPTGVKYPKNHGGGRIICTRFAPWGGWDLATSLPDFNPGGGVTYPSSPNQILACGNNSSADDRTWYVSGPGYLQIFSQYNQGAYEFEGMGLHAGDVKELTSDWPMPRAMLNRVGNGIDFPANPANDSLWLSEGYATTSSQCKMTFPKHDGVWIDESWSLTDNYDMGGVLPLPLNPYAGGMELDAFPFIPIPTVTLGPWFSVPGLRKITGIGLTLFSNKEWLSTADGWTIAIAWDGATPVY